jgi:hypothetical protein
MTKDSGSSLLLQPQLRRHLALFPLLFRSPSTDLCIRQLMCTCLPKFGSGWQALNTQSTSPISTIPLSHYPTPQNTPGHYIPLSHYPTIPLSHSPRSPPLVKLHSIHPTIPLSHSPEQTGTLHPTFPLSHYPTIPFSQITSLGEATFDPSHYPTIPLPQETGAPHPSIYPTIPLSHYLILPDHLPW